MPCVSRFRGIVIAIYYREHPPPHFHARCGGAAAAIGIDPLVLLGGRLPPSLLSQVLDWAALHRGELTMAWERVQEHEPPKQIPPLP